MANKLAIIKNKTIDDKKIIKNDNPHYELCKLTDEWQLKKWHIILYEYQTMLGNEFPDVLCYKNGYTELYEIKIDYQDFKRDSLKECRNEIKIKYSPYYRRYSGTDKRIKEILFKQQGTKEFIKQDPHLGRKRYYVCPKGLINPDEIKNGFGLYYFNNGRFRKIKESKNFKCNIYYELNLLSHAFRKYASGKTDNILINTFEIKW